MFAEIRMDIADRGGVSQETDVLDVDVEVVEVVEESSRYVVSVRFTGRVREERNGPLEEFDEMWHMVKPLEGNVGWRLAGIQQMR